MLAKNPRRTVLVKYLASLKSEVTLSYAKNGIQVVTAYHMCHDICFFFLLQNGNEVGETAEMVGSKRANR